MITLLQSQPVDLYRSGFQVKEQAASDYRGDDFQIGLRYGAQNENLTGQFESYTAFKLLGMRHHLFWGYDLNEAHNFGYVTSIGSDYISLGGGVLYDNGENRYPLSLLINTPFGYLGGSYRFNDDRYIRFDLGIRPFEQLGFSSGLFYRKSDGWSFATGVTLYDLLGVAIGYQFSSQIEFKQISHTITFFWDVGHSETGGGWSSRDNHWFLESILHTKKNRARSMALDRFYLHIKLDQPMSQGGDGGVLKGNTYTFLNLLVLLKQGLNDPRVKGFIFEVRGTPLKMGQVSEVTELLSKGDQKEVILHLTDPNLSTYLLGSVATKIVLHPAGFFQIQGASFSQLYFNQFFKLLGVEPHFSRRSEFKSAPESFTHNRPTKEALSSLQKLGKEVRQWSKEQILMRRRIVGVHTIIDRAPYAPTEALKLGLVDQLGYIDDLIEPLRKCGVGVISPRRYHTLYRHELYGMERTVPIAILNLEGVIGAGSASIWGDQGITPSKILNAIKQIKHGDYAGVVVRIDSPGGSGLISDDIYHALIKLRKKMPVYISMGRVAASGGYYIAAAGEKIYANPMTLTGSIGVYMGHFVIKKMLKKLMISVFSMSLWKNGHFMSFFNEPNDALTYKQECLVEDFYTLFKKRVKTGRRMSDAVVESVAKGQVFFGREAKQKGLVDEIGGLHDAMRGLQIRLDTDLPVVATVYPQNNSFLKKILMPERHLLIQIKTTLKMLRESTLLLLPFELNE